MFSPRLSAFGNKISSPSGTRQLMDDLGELAATGRDIKPLGGGNPARIPEVEALFRESLETLLEDADRFERLAGRYDSPQGQGPFLEAVATLLRRCYGWEITEANVALTSGSQTAFFFLFNLLAGRMEDGEHRRIQLPVTPEYIGYADSGIEPGMFVANRPEIELVGDDQFKYHVDFDALHIGADVGAVCVSRPTNPTSNVLSDSELSRLAELTRSKGIPLIIDNAYGAPFPNIQFIEADPLFDEHVILSMSLSKLGLPGVRTGIVVANEKVISSLTSMNAVVSLAPSSFGAALVQPLIDTAQILEMSDRLIRPYYASKCAQALGWLRESLDSVSFRVHRPEGAFFFWLWFEGLPITSQELYERLKARDVIVVPGHHFFPGLEEPWDHRNECIRINYSQDEASVREGIAILGDELRKL